jgi:hypothetical protein
VYIKKFYHFINLAPGKKNTLIRKTIDIITSFAASDTPQEVFSGNCHCTTKIPKKICDDL